MDWRQGSYIHQYYKNNENLSDRSLVEDIQIFMVQNFEGFLKWYDNIFILELKFKLLNEHNIHTDLSEDERFRQDEIIVKRILYIYNYGRYQDVEYHITQSIENHKEKLERYRGYGHYGYIDYIWR